MFSIEPTYHRMAFADGGDELAIRLPIDPAGRLPGSYQITPRLNFWADNCEAIRAKDQPSMPPSRLPAGTFLGVLEGRCPHGMCGVHRYLRSCDDKAKLPLSPISITLHPPTPGSPEAAVIEQRQRAARETQCTDGLGSDGQWVELKGCPASASSDIPAPHGDLCSICMESGNPMRRCENNRRYKIQGRIWHFVRSNCSFAYPPTGASQKWVLRCFQNKGVTHVVFIGDSIMRNLYNALMELLSHSVDDAYLKHISTSNIVTQEVKGVAFSYIENWFPDELPKKVAPKLQNFFSTFPLRPQNSFGKSPVVLFITNLGVMHQITSSCSTVPDFPQSALNFRQLLRDWLAALGSPRPDIRGFFYGATPVNGLVMPGYTLAKGRQATRLMQETLGEEMPEEDREFPFPFQLIDPYQALLPRLDATYDGIHYGLTAHQTPMIALLNSLCRGLLLP